MSESARGISESAHGDRDGGSSSPRTSVGDGDDGTDGQPARKRQRVRLSCLECRRRKLSCDRGFPCERCLKSGTPDRCTYESRPGVVPPVKPAGLTLSQYDGRLTLNNDQLSRKDGMREFERIRRLEVEVAQLKNLLSKQINSDGTLNLADGASPTAQKPASEGVPETNLPPSLQYGHDADGEMRFFRGKEYRTRYYGAHNASMAFSQLTGLSPFMRETADEWLRPLHIAAGTKKHSQTKAERQSKFARPDHELEALLPSKAETDLLITVYLDQFEQLHRIVHIPSFKRLYAKFWIPTEVRPASHTALILSMMSISSCMNSNSSSPPKFQGLVSAAHQTAEKWIWACDEWSRKQSHKHRRIVHYQIYCLLFLAKRVNTIKKKRFWTNSGILAREGISLGLHRDPDMMIGGKSNISIFHQEMRRRLWAVTQEFDFQASFDHGLPTIINSLHMDIKPPRNLNDEDFDEDSTELPPSKPVTEYTAASYQHLSRQSLPLRLELSKLLCQQDEPDYEQVIRYTNDITQEIDALPSWDTSASMEGEGSMKPLLAYTLLHIQLRQYIMPLHQPFLRMRKVNSKYQFSEVMFYNAARDMVLLHDKLTESGVRTLNFLREDQSVLALNLTSVTMLQPRGSTNMIMVNSQHTLKLLDKCLQMKEDRILRCGNNEPWGYSIMCAAYGLLETHLGNKESQAAKSSSAERFVNLHYRLLAGQEPPSSSGGQQQAGPQMATGANENGMPKPGEYVDIRLKSVTPFMAINQGAGPGPGPGPGIDVGPGAPGPGAPWWLMNADPALQQQQQIANPELNMELLGFNLGDLWADTWEAY